MLAAATAVFNVHREGSGPRMVLVPSRPGGGGGGRSFSLPNLSTVFAPSPRVEASPSGLGQADWQLQQAQQQGQQQQQHMRRPGSSSGVQPSASVEMLDAAASSAASEAASSPPGTPHPPAELGALSSAPAGGRSAPAPPSLASAGSPLPGFRSLQRSLPSWGCIRSSKSDGSEEMWPNGASLAPAGPPVELSLKVAGVHWWYRTRSHAGELTAGRLRGCLAWLGLWGAGAA